MAELTMDDVLADDRLQQGPGRLAPEIRQIGGREVGPEDGRNPASIGKARVYVGNQPATGFLRQGLKKNAPGNGSRRANRSACLATSASSNTRQFPRASMNPMLGDSINRHTQRKIASVRPRNASTDNCGAASN